jgi:hypothetical protein
MALSALFDHSLIRRRCLLLLSQWTTPHSSSAPSRPHSGPSGRARRSSYSRQVTVRTCDYDRSLSSVVSFSLMANRVDTLFISHTRKHTGQLVCLLFPIADVGKPTGALNTQDGPPFEVSAALYTELLERGEGQGQEGAEAAAASLERLELSGPCPESIKPRRGREWLGRWRRRSCA